ncbi:cell division protein FtsZ [Candidatus Saccharibacteria bacterium]|nr:cell division protein FtsZ [Candidatus Saccharibacteria bacterium]
MPKTVEPPIETFARIKVVGVGGAGGAAINRMVDAGVSGVEFVAVNADAQALHHSKANEKVHIGQKTTKGLGAGADPELGRRSAEESKEDIAKALADADMIFVTFGAGGGTGSGAGPLVAEAAKAAGALVVGFATKPFAFEGEKRRRNAETAIEKLRHYVDTLITIPNDKLLQTIDRRTPLLEAFKVADDVLRQGVQGISDLITVHGLVNLDFADVKTIMADAGSSLMGIGRASGENRAIEAAQQAISSPLLEISIDGARGILFNVIGGLDMSMHEINTVAETITAAADAEANIIFGATINPDLEGEIIVTVVATGFDEAYFTSPERTGARVQRRIVEPEAATIGQVDEESMKNLDLELKEGMPAHAEDFHSEEAPNIWALSDDGNTTDKDKAEEEEKYETPTFFRRFRRKKGQPKGDTDTDDGDEEPVEIEPAPEDKSDSSDKDKETKS